MQAGLEVVWANDIDKDAVATLCLNLGKKIRCIHQGDITQITSQQIMEEAEVKPGELGLIEGGPPCQGFSAAGRRLIDDPRNRLFKEYVRVLRDLQPKVFEMENVPGLLSMKSSATGGLIIDEIVEEFNRAGYDVQYALLDAVDYGVPQYRRRVIIIGSRKDIRTAKPIEKRPLRIYWDPVMTLHGRPPLLPRIRTVLHVVGPDES
jgi:DNA (cytosine-5)-methyltransferase 1